MAPQQIKSDVLMMDVFRGLFFTITKITIVKSAKMYGQMTPEVERSILELSKQKWGRTAIVEYLKTRNISVSERSVYNVIHKVGKTRKFYANKENVAPKRVSTPRRNRVAVQKVAKIIKNPNPPSQREIAKRCNVSQRTVNNIIHQYLDKKTFRKTRLHVLKDSHKENRKTNSRKLYERHLAGGKSEFVVTLDEAWFYLQNCNGKRRIYYEKRRAEADEYVYENSEKFSDKFMVVGAITGRGPLPLIRVPEKVKINSAYYIEHVLKPLLEDYVPKLYGEDTSKVFVHHDAAPSHTSRATAAYAADLKSRLGISIIDKSEIPVKSPDTSPMDFFGFGYLKQRLFRRRAKTLEGLWKVLKEEWDKVGPEMTKKVIESWKLRLRTVNKRNGEHIEHCKQIHRRKVSE